MFDPRVPVARSAVRRADDQIHRLAAVLRSERPVSAAGAAAARLLLTNASSAVYHRPRGAGDALATALGRVLAAL